MVDLEAVDKMLVIQTRYGRSVAGFEIEDSDGDQIYCHLLKLGCIYLMHNNALTRFVQEDIVY